MAKLKPTEAGTALAKCIQKARIVGVLSGLADNMTRIRGILKDNEHRFKVLEGEADANLLTQADQIILDEFKQFNDRACMVQEKFPGLENNVRIIERRISTK